MLIPLSCDAPIYHWPFATVGLIATNVAVFFLSPQLMGDMPDHLNGVAQLLVLEHGNGIHPIQWLTSIFMHAGMLHLLGNMLFLWIFGLVVEGKIGWWKFLLIYLALGVTQSGIEQFIMLGFDGFSFSLGASSAIYGIMIVAVIWAPKNDIHCFYWFAFWAMGTLDVPIMFFALFYLGFDVLGMLLGYYATGSFMGTGLLHVMGALVGAPVGLVLLQKKMVDCEGWDLLNVWNGADPSAEPDYQKVDQEVLQKKQAREERLLAAAKEQLDHYLAEDNVRAAVALHAKMSQVGEGLKLDRKTLLAIIKGLHARREWAASAEFMQELITRFPEGADAARVKLAQICVTEIEKPARALELLSKVDFRRQSATTVALAKKIAKRAQQMQAEGVYELEEEGV